MPATILGSPVIGGRWITAIACFLIVASFAASLSADEPLVMVVMDPLAAPLACPCVEGHAQRDYDKLAAFLAKRLDRPVKAVFAEDLGKALRGETHGRIDLVIGKQSVVKFDAKENRLTVRPLAMLTGQDGGTTINGLFVVRSRDPAKQLSDLRGYKVLFGPVESDEKHSAAAAALRAAGVEAPETLEVRGGCSDAALEIIEDKENRKLAAVISSYAMPLLEGCHTIEKGAIKMIGQTAAVPFVTAFVTDRIDDDVGKRIKAGLLAVGDDVAMLRALESKRGFVEMPADDKKTSQAWPGWRGANRDAIVARLPERLSARPKFLWTKPLMGTGLAGIAATEKNVIVADRDALDQRDVFRCLDAATGAQRWQLDYAAPGHLDYGNSPRATPLIYDGKAYLLGAFGDLDCVDLSDGSVIWKRNIVREHQARLPTWGMSASPLAVDGRLIVNPGAAAASLVALDCTTGKELWRCPGAMAAYASFIVGRFGGVRQIVGYDAFSLGGWDIATGKRRWTLVPPEKGDFNVPTPIALGGRLLVSTENNGTRLYDFDGDGMIRPKPLAENVELSPDASTPVVLDGRVFGCRTGLYCLDAASLKTVWSSTEKTFDDYVSLIGGSGRVLVSTLHGELILLKADGPRYEPISRMTVFNDGEMYSHPALVGNRLYLRSAGSVYCVVLE